MSTNDNNETLRALLDSDDINAKCDAAIRLAELRDESLLSRVSVWLDAKEKRLRHLAHECLLKAFTDEGRQTLWDRWKSGAQAEDKLSLSTTLMLFGERRVEPYLEKVAQEADGIASVVAATAIYSREKADLFPRTYRVSRNMPLDAATSRPRLNGLCLMRHIIESGNERAKRGMEIQIYNLGGDYDWESAHHADVTEEAVKWIERECIVWRKEAN